MICETCGDAGEVYAEVRCCGGGACCCNGQTVTQSWACPDCESAPLAPTVIDAPGF